MLHTTAWGMRASCEASKKACKNERRVRLLIIAGSPPAPPPQSVEGRTQVNKRAAHARLGRIGVRCSAAGSIGAQWCCSKWCAFFFGADQDEPA